MPPDAPPESEPKKKRRPPTKTIRRVLDWLDEYGFSVYGGFIDPESGMEGPGQRDYNVDEILKVVKHIQKGTTWRDSDD